MKASRMLAGSCVILDVDVLLLPGDDGGGDQSFF